MIQGQLVDVVEKMPAALHNLRQPFTDVTTIQEAAIAPLAHTIAKEATIVATQAPPPTTTTTITTTKTASAATEATTATTTTKKTTKLTAMTKFQQGEAILLSANRPVKADVRGNLGEPSVVTNEQVADWLKDRWQSAKNMNGEPIPGEHWLEIDLERECLVTSAFIDWEDAYSENYVLEGKKSKEETTWTLLANSQELKSTKRSAKHIEHKLALKTTSSPTRHVRLRIISTSTRWGSSVWRLQIWGHAPLEDAK